MLEIFLKLRSFRDNLFQGKQREQVTTRLIVKNYCGLDEQIQLYEV